MRLRPFLILTTCLLGACEKKDAAPGSHLPDTANTRSSLRDPDGGTRSSPDPEQDRHFGFTRAINRINSAKERHELDAFADLAGTVIRFTDPAEFDAIWNRLAGIEDPEIRRDLQVLALHHLAAREDITAVWRLIREKMWKDLAEHERKMVLAELIKIANPSITQKVDLLRAADPADRKLVGDEIFREPIEPKELLALETSGGRFSEEETRFIIGNYEGPQFTSFPRGANRELKSAYSSVLETVISLEGKGVLAKGARDMFLNVIGGSYADLYLELVPPAELHGLLQREDSEPVIDNIIVADLHGILPGAELRDGRIPTYFFTATGTTANLPADRIGVAVAAWQFKDTPGAEAWFAANADSLPQDQQDLARAGFAKNLWRADPAAARVWLGQVHDPALREKTLAEQKETE